MVAPNPKRILIVDDSGSAADAIALFCKLEGHDAMVAHDGAEGIAVATDFKPEIVLLDLNMPRMDGYEAARLLRKLPDCSEVVIIAVTGWEPSDIAEELDAAGFDHCLCKPIAPKDLRELLARIA